MTDHDDAELWTTLAREWQEISAPGEHSPSGLRSYVDLHSRRLRRLLLLDIAVTIAALACAGWFLAQDREPFSILISLDIAVVLVVVWTFSLVTGRGLWRASAASTSEFLALARRFALRRLHTTHLAIALLVAQVAAVLLFFPRVPLPLGLPVRVLPIIGAIAWLAWAVGARHRALRELRGIDEIETQNAALQ
jgi:hypothetical protein